MACRTVYVAEDDDDMRRLISESLRDAGHVVLEARDGADLLTLLAAAKISARLAPDVIVTDILMPGYSGMGVLAALRSAQWDVPVIVVTARVDRATDSDARRLGAVEVLHKPIDAGEVRAAVDRLDARHR